MEHAGICFSLMTCQNLAVILPPPESPSQECILSDLLRMLKYPPVLLQPQKRMERFSWRIPITKSHLHMQVVVVPGRLTLDLASIINIRCFLNYSQQDQVDPIMLTLCTGWSTHSISQLIDPEVGPTFPILFLLWAGSAGPMPPEPPSPLASQPEVLVSEHLDALNSFTFSVLRTWYRLGSSLFGCTYPGGHLGFWYTFSCFHWGN